VSGRRGSRRRGPQRRDLAGLPVTTALQVFRPLRRRSPIWRSGRHCPGPEGRPVLAAMGGVAGRCAVRPAVAPRGGSARRLVAERRDLGGRVFGGGTRRAGKSHRPARPSAPAGFLNLSPGLRVNLSRSGLRRTPTLPIADCGTLSQLSMIGRVTPATGVTFDKADAAAGSRDESYGPSADSPSEDRRRSPGATCTSPLTQL
jgi:hypothetical protein